MNSGSDHTTRWMRWTARIISVFILAYVLLMVGGMIYNLLTLGVADPYARGNVPFIETLPPILMFISAFALTLAIRWERIGAVTTLVLQAVIILLLFIDNPRFEDFPRRALPYFLVLVFILPALLFLVSWRREHQRPA